MTLQDYRKGHKKTRAEGLPVVDEKMLADYDARREAEAKQDAETYRLAWEAEEAAKEWHEAPTVKMPENYQEVFLSDWTDAPTVKIRKDEQ